MKTDDTDSMLEPGTRKSSTVGDKVSDLADQAKRIPEAKRMSSFINKVAATAGKDNEQLGKCLEVSKPILVGAWRCILYLAPIYVKLYQLIYKVYTLLPTNIIQMVFGICLCFGGGHYFAVLAAAEAFRLFGWDSLRSRLEIVWDQVKVVEEANKADDMVDADGDGVADVSQIDDPRALVKRKVTVAGIAVTKPQELQAAVGFLWAAWMSVLGTLRLEFARTTALAIAIVQMSEFVFLRALLPLVISLLGEKLKHWGETIITSTLNVIAILIAVYIQTIISAFYSAIRGGKMFAEALFKVLVERGYLSKLPCAVFKDGTFDPNDTIIDEVVAYAIAAAGFAYQISSNFAVPFPLNIVLFPLDILEWVLRSQIYATDSALSMQP